MSTGRPRFSLTLLVACLTLLNATTARAQSPSSSPAQKNPPEEQSLPSAVVAEQERHAEAGRYFVQNFSPTDYDAHNANWAVAQDSSGLLYVGNTDGALVFDGGSWELIPVTNRSTVRSLAVDADDRVYLGARSEIGYLSPDSAGAIRYVSLLEHLSEEDRDFSDVWQTFAAPEGVYFMAPQRLMRWSDGSFQVWPASTTFHVSFLVRDTLYVRQRGVGMLRMTDEGLRLIPGGDVLSDEEVFVLLPHGEHGLLAVTRTMGVLVHDGAAFRPFSTAATEFLEENQIYHGAVLPDGSYALGTLRGGVAVVDSSGAFIRTIDKSTGLRDQKTWFTFVDRDGGLWLGLDDGVARVDVSSPVTYFDDRAGLEGWIGDIVRHDGTLFVATGLGVYELVPAGAGEPAAFRHIPEIDVSCWALLSTDTGLLAACQDRTYAYEEGRVRIVHTQSSGHAFLRSRHNPNWAYEGLSDGLMRLHLEDGRWEAAGRVTDVSTQTFTLAEDSDGALWLGTGHQGMVRLDFGAQISAAPRIERFDTRHGLPEGWTNAYSFDGGVLIGAQTGLLRFDEATQRFVADTTLTAPFTDEPREVFLLHEDALERTWLYSDPDIVSLRRQESGGYRVDEHALSRLPSAQAYRFFSEEDGTVWVGRLDGLYRLDSAGVGRPSSRKALVRSVAAIDGDSLIIGRRPTTGASTQLPARLNSLRFTFGLPQFEDVASTRYQTLLDGFDREWSDWTPTVQRDYTNLPHGDYVFRVRARDAYGAVSPEAAVGLSILPPWYRTWWMYAFYALMGAGLIMVVASWRSRRLLHQKRQLEAIVHERTAEIEEQRRQLQIQAEALLEHDELKSRFFANVSHEFRTPLTLTIGPLDDLKSGLYGPLDEEIQEQVDLALRNSRRLLRLINQLLDAAKIESGGLALHLDVGDLAAYLRRVAEAFAALAERKQIRFEIDIPETPIWVRYDDDQLEKVFSNLLSNAFKFTPRNGRMRISLQATADDKARISVEDSGAGIPPNEIGSVFERFYQVEGTRRAAGTGIGLSLAKELVEMHGGRISVQSREGFGTIFTVDLPIQTAQELERADTGGASVDTSEQTNDGAADIDAAVVAAGAFDGSFDGDEIAGTTKNPAEGSDREDVTTVLIADDNADVRAYLRRHLEKMYRILEADDGAAALEMVRERLPDVVISDVVMPEMDGFVLCEAIKADPELDFIPVILLTAKAASEDRIEGWKEGADAYLTKPFEMAELQARVANLIASRQRLRDHIRHMKAVRAEPAAVVSADEAYLHRVRAAVEANLSNSSFSVAVLASEVGQSRVQLYRRLQDLLAKSPSDLIREIRLQHAATLLAGRAGTVSEIAYGVGFKSVSHFCKCFRDQFGASPTEYLEEAARSGAND